MNVVIIGAGFAGAATAYALTRLGAGSGVILERESAVGRKGNPNSHTGV